MKKSIFLITITATLILAGCTGGTQKSGTLAQEQKTGNIILEGTVTNAGGKYYINAIGRPVTQIDSYTLKFDPFVGKKVKITGQYSGDTLFVDKIE